MESNICVKATPNEMETAFNSNDPLYSIRYYSILFDVSCYTDKEWESMFDVKFPYEVVIRHGECNTGLNEKRMYSSWNNVVNALKKKVETRRKNNE